MQRAIRPEWLLRLANQLLGQGPGQPRNADLRRAVSTAYYALFHRITVDTAQHLPGGTDEEPRRAARYVTHTSVHQVCGWISGETPPRHLTALVDRLRSSHDVAYVAASYSKLHDEREAADYDHLANFTRPGTRAVVRQAQRSVALLEQHHQVGEIRSFLGLIVLRTSIR